MSEMRQAIACRTLFGLAIFAWLDALQFGKAELYPALREIVFKELLRINFADDAV